MPSNRVVRTATSTSADECKICVRQISSTREDVSLRLKLMADMRSLSEGSADGGSANLRSERVRGERGSLPLASGVAMS